MLSEININGHYRSTGGYLFKVDNVAQHGQDCSIRMVIYTNLEPTFDSPPGRVWVIEESIFLKRFTASSDIPHPPLLPVPPLLRISEEKYHGEKTRKIPGLDMND